MVVNTIKENLSVNKKVATRKEIVFVEGDVIVPDAKPDVLNIICTSGVVCIYKKESQSKRNYNTRNYNIFYNNICGNMVCKRHILYRMGRIFSLGIKLKSNGKL